MDHIHLKRNPDGSYAIGTINLEDDGGTLELGLSLWRRFCRDMEKDPNMAKARLVSGIQVAIRDARSCGWTTDPTWNSK
jgi:hypothetical protein